MNDRQRCEAIFFPVFFQNIARCGVSEKSSDDYRACMLQLQQAIDAAMTGCEERRYNQIMRRVCRVHNEVTAAYRAENVRVEKMGLMALYCLQAVLDAEYLVLEEGSDLSEAIMAVVRGLEHAFAEERLDASARKQSGRMLRELQTRGYFEGVESKREAA